MPLSLGAGLAIGAGAQLLGGVLANKAIKDTNAQNYAMNKEFAQHGIRWKVADAKAAGIHPLAALGTQTNSPTVALQADDQMGQAMSATGQQIMNMAMQNEALASDAEVKRTQALLNLARVDDIAKIPSLFIDARDPISGETIRVLNPDFGQLEGTAAWLGGLQYANPDKDLTTIFGKRYFGSQEPKSPAAVTRDYPQERKQELDNFYDMPW